jgi:hypothetical protein
MAIIFTLSKPYFDTMSYPESKPCLWNEKYVIENLPSWLYSDNQEPNSAMECKAKISALQYTIQDIDLQIEIRELELKNGLSRHGSSFEFEKWKAQALRAKQTHTYLLNAYSYWLLLNEKDTSILNTSEILRKLIKLLIEEPKDFTAQLEELL